MRGAERVFDGSAVAVIVNKKKKSGNQIKIYEKKRKKKKKVEKNKKYCNEIGSGFRLKIEVTRYLYMYIYRITSRGKILRS